MATNFGKRSFRQIRGATGVGVDPSGNVYVVDCGNNRVLKFDGSGKFLYQQDGHDGQFDQPFGVAVGPSGDRWYVTDIGNYRVEKFDSSGNFEQVIDGTTKHPLNNAYGVADADPYVYVTDSEDGAVQVFDESGDWLKTLTGGKGKFNLPFALAVDASGDLFVVDPNNSRVVVFNSVQEYWLQFGSTAFNGIAVAGMQTGTVGDIGQASIVYVTDPGNSRVLTWQWMERTRPPVADRWLAPRRRAEAGCTTKLGRASAQLGKRFTTRLRLA